MTPDVRLRVFKDPWSSTTHFAGFWLALAAAALLVSRAAGDLPRTTGMAIYGASLVALFLASSFYHFLDLGPRGNRWLKRLDHSAIFFLIAGTAVPTLLLVLAGQRTPAGAGARARARRRGSAAQDLLDRLPRLARHVPLPGAQRAWWS